jgi:hypothetical protein
MKKIILALSLALVLVLMAALPCFAHDMVTYAEWGTPTIDAVKEDIWDKAQSIEISDVAIEGDEANYSSAVVWSLWDGKFVYFFAEVTDPIIDAELKDDAWNQDALGFMIDYAYVRDQPEVSYRDLPAEESYAGYVNVPPVEGDANYPEGPSIFGIPEYANGVKSYCVLTDKGWNVEIAIPLLYKDYQPGDMIGYEICLNNGDGDGSRASQFVWKQRDDALGNESWRYAYNFGTLIFNPLIEETVAEPAAEEAAPAADAVAPAAEVAAAPAAAAPAPQTGDIAILALVGLIGSAAVVIKKRR